jgi:DNA-binding GntR family transcriptional regulator
MVSHCGSLQLVRYHASVIELYMRYQVLALHRRPFRGQASVEEHQKLLKHLLDDETESVLAVLDLHIQKGFMLPDPQLKTESKAIA